MNYSLLTFEQIPEAAKDSLSDVSSAAVIKDVPNPPNDVHHVNVYQDMGNPDDFTAMVSDAENVNAASGDEECVEKEDNPLDEATATKRTHLKMQSSTRISVKLLVVLLALPEVP
ncbi:hypothetical protein AM587_10001718 [Phytophthora nicotianae]|uniref:Uncharacterized protein n=1 Tax=Phytophthora nicotianae TaxID=4792 RepID=A0A0W8BVP3_PHYNI|nr:hypothetical protein AM587_10001718 [Phytophthora nicotianae]